MFGIWKILRMAWKLKADVYHFHDPELLFAGCILRLLRRVPVIYDVHEAYPQTIVEKRWIPKPLRKLASMVFSLLEHLMVPIIGTVIYVTTLVGERYKGIRCKSIQIANYPPLEMFGPPTCINYMDKSANIIFTGGMTENRGIRELVKAIAEVKEEYPQVKLYLVGLFGSDYFEKEIKNLIRELGLGRNIQLIGMIPFEEVNQWLQKCRIGIFPYLPYEHYKMGLPVKLLEYMAAGLAVVSSDFPLNREVISGANCGVLIKPGDVKDLAKALKTLLGDPLRVRRLGERGRRAILEKYNWDADKIKLLDLYKSLQYQSSKKI